MRKDEIKSNNLDLLGKEDSVKIFTQEKRKEIWLERVGVVIRFLTISILGLLIVSSLGESFDKTLASLTLGDLTFSILKIGLIIALFLWLFRWRQDCENIELSNYLWGAFGALILILIVAVGLTYLIWTDYKEKDFDYKQYIIDERVKGTPDDVIYDELLGRGILLPASNK